MLKASGYLISILSVSLLAIVSWSEASDGWIRALVLLGALCSIAGMGLRWRSFTQGEKTIPQPMPGHAVPATHAAPEPSPPRHEPEEAERLA